MIRMGCLLVPLVGCVDDNAAFCEDVPTITWDSFGQDFIQHNCLSCHSARAAERNGAPVNIVLDTQAKVLEHKERVLHTISGGTPMMPPYGGVDTDDLWQAEVWLRCVEP